MFIKNFIIASFLFTASILANPMGDLNRRQASDTSTATLTSITGTIVSPAGPTQLSSLVSAFSSQSQSAASGSGSASNLASIVSSLYLVAVNTTGTITPLGTTATGIPDYCTGVVSFYSFLSGAASSCQNASTSAISGSASAASASASASASATAAPSNDSCAFINEYFTAAELALDACTNPSAFPSGIATSYLGIFWTSACGILGGGGNDSSVMTGSPDGFSYSCAALTVLGSAPASASASATSASAAATTT
ncbi:hypothetical protein YB2330_006446 [Saitoella coloradoensis]